MKVLLVIFTICISYTLSEGTTIGTGKVYPKKYRPYSNGKILINAAKYEKSSNPPVMRSYTAFQVVGANLNVAKADVPDSPYFPVDQGYDQKARVKKVLALESPWSLLRNKRSAVLNVSPVEKEDKKIEAKAAEVEKVKEITPLPTAAAEETTVKTTSSPKEVQEESKSTIKINTTTAKSVTDVEIERTGSTAKKVNLVRKGNKPKPKSKTALKKNNGRVSRNAKPKPKGKNAAAGRAKPKGKNAAAGRAKPKGKKTKSAKKPKQNQIARKKENTRKVKTQRSKKQKAKPKTGTAGKIPKGKPVQPTNMGKKTK